MINNLKYYYCIVLCFIIYCLRNILLSMSYIGVYYGKITPYIIIFTLTLFYSFILYYFIIKKNVRFPVIKPYIIIIIVVLDFALRLISPEIFSDANTPSSLFVYSSIKVIDRVFVLIFAALSYYRYYKGKKSTDN